MDVDAKQRWHFLLSHGEWTNHLHFKNATRMDAENAQALINELIRDQDSILAMTRQRLSCFGDTFMKRWAKWTPTKRRKALHKLSPTHTLWQDQWSFAEMSSKEPGDIAVLSDAQLLLPYLNMESLCDQSLKLPCLLRNRMRTSPAEWASADRKQMSFLPVVDRYYKYSPSYGSTVREKYGALIDGSTVQPQSMGFPALYVVLSAQKSLAQFLHDIVDVVLEVVDERGKGCSGWDDFVNESPETNSISMSQWPTYGNEPFSSPYWYQLASIVEIANARSQEAQDTFYSLQTDPIYVKHFLEADKTMPTYITADKVDRAGLLTASMLRPLQRLLFWEWVYSYSSKRLNLTRNLTTKDAATRISLFSAILKTRWRVCQHELRQLLPTQPSFKEYFKLETSSTGKRTLRTHSPFEKSWEGELSFWTLCWLTIPGNDPLRFRRPISYQLFFHLLEHHPSAKGLNQGICNQISEMAELDEIRCILEGCGSPIYEMDVEALRTALQESRQTQLYNVKRQILEKPILDITKSGFDLLNIVNGAAITGPRDKDWLANKNNAQGHLGSFWTNVREYSWIKHPLATKLDDKSPFPTESGDAGSLADLDNEREKEIERMSACSSEKHQKTMAEETATIITGNLKERSTTLWEMQPWNRPIGHTEDNIVNVKRGPANRTTCSSLEEEAEENTHKNVWSDLPVAQPETPIVRVKKAHLDRLRMLFPAKNAQRSVRWIDFVAAMRDAGFEVRPSNGAAVRFISRSQGTIIFHKPHPHESLENPVLHTMGNRMNKWFGWTLDSLQERQSQRGLS